MVDNDDDDNDTDDDDDDDDDDDAHDDDNGNDSLLWQRSVYLQSKYNDVWLMMTECLLSSSSVTFG